MSQNFRKLYEGRRKNINVKLGLSNYATKANTKGATGVDTLNSAAKLVLLV